MAAFLTTVSAPTSAPGSASPTAGLLRLSTGLEAPTDLVADLAQTPDGGVGDGPR
ncbi:hypothetical protein ACIRQQ_02475 [Streptomyces fuscichromogenes]|uniref:hypothetical protein n=1 Tax=Streptomyces fuscichromogenes TaxID=1324013 RepID=UPI0038034801